MSTGLPTKHGFYMLTMSGTYFEKQIQQDRAWEVAESGLVASLIRHMDYCVDAGAYVGYYACLMASVGAWVEAIEPNSQVFGLLERNVRQNHWPVRCHNFAVSDVEGTADFFLSPGFDDGWASLAAARDNDQSNIVQVETRRFDKFLCAGPIRLIKLDVEGAEVPALRGLGDRLKDVDHLLIECIDIPYRVSRIDSTIAGINQVLSGWTVRRCNPNTGLWGKVSAASILNSEGHSENFLFTNPRLGDEL